MVVVTIISIVAALAVPSFSQARNDRIAFDYARQYQQILMQGRSRAAGSGSAHLALLGPGADSRGFVRLFAALDGQPRAPLNLTGPNPVASCKSDPEQWNEALTEPVDLNGTRARFITWTDLNRKGVNEDMDLRAQLMLGDGAVSSALEEKAFLAICITPAGITYVGSGSTATAAITAMRAATAFNGIAEIRIQRHRNTEGLGLLRRVTLSGGGAPRLRSE